MRLKSSALSGEAPLSGGRQAHAWAAAALLSTIAFARHAVAEPSPPNPVEVDAQYDALAASLARGESAARLWWWGWTGGFAAVAVGEGVVAIATHDPGTRESAVVGLGGSVLGVGAMLFASRAAFTYRARLDSMDASTREARLLRLREAEKILDEAANDEEQGRSWFAHVGGDAVTLAGTVVLWAGYHQYANGWLNLLGGTVVTEAQILTRPTAAILARRAFRAGRRPPPAPSFTWTVLPSFGGAGLVGTF
jgi:hypothetical protein